MADELKPCPFCGGEAEHAVGKRGNGEPWEYIECGVCGATADGAIAWNTRAAPPPEPSEAWQPIETAPKDGAWVLAARGVIPYVTAWDDGEEIWFTFNRGYESVREKHEGLKGVVWEPTHWMPLPEPPAIAALRAAQKGE